MAVHYMSIGNTYYVGTYFSPAAYTLPDGLQSVNGSSSTGGCQPGSCVMMPISSTTINGCDCPGTDPVSGVLIDGVIPSIDTTQQRWASELFTVNRNGQDSTEITSHDEQNSISMFTNSCYQKPSTTETISHDEQNSISMFTNSCYQRPSTTEITLHDKQNSIPMFTNSCYQRPSTLLNHEVSDPSTINCNRSTGRYDDTDVHYYDVIPENIKLSCENESISDTAWTRK